MPFQSLENVSIRNLDSTKLATRLKIKVKYLPAPDSRSRPPRNSDIFLSLSLFGRGGFLSSEQPVLSPFERTGKIYRQTVPATEARRRRLLYFVHPLLRPLSTRPTYSHWRCIFRRQDPVPGSGTRTNYARPRASVLAPGWPYWPGFAGLGRSCRCVLSPLSSPLEH